LKERKALVINAINDLGPGAEDEPFAGDPEFTARVDAWMEGRDVDREHATLLQVLREMDHPTEPIQRIINAADGQPLELTNSPQDQWLAELARRLLGS
jgi:hypothetical protein